MPGPICVSRLPEGFIDEGTNCRTRARKRGPANNGDGSPALRTRLYRQRFAPPTRRAVVKAAAAFLMRDDVEGFRPYPYCPAPGSGVTIGFGYDLKFHDEEQLRKDWAALGTKALDRLAECREQDPVKAVAKLRDISIPRDVAEDVAQSTVAEYYDMTRRVFRGVERLPLGVQVALTSVIFNRGSKERLHRKRDQMTRWEKHGIAPWREMRFIQQAVRTGNLFDVYYYVQAMSRVWSDTPIERSMKRRRQLEAAQILPYVRRYDEYEEDSREFPNMVDWRDYLDY